MSSYRDFFKRIIFNNHFLIFSLDCSKRTFSGSSLDVDLGNNKSNIPPTPPVHKVLFEKCHRTTRSMSQFKGTKTLLGSSLDQGLNQPASQSEYLNSKSKRICKSEECAIDNAALTLPKVVCSISSSETLNENIYVNKRDSVNRFVNNETNDMLLESDIEIMIPMSVSNPKTRSDSIEDAATLRQRSSNSISSCEMAISISLVDGEDSSNGNSSIKNEENCDSVFVSQENCIDSKNILANQSTGNSVTSERTEPHEVSGEDCVYEQLLKKDGDSTHSLENIVDCDNGINSTVSSEENFLTSMGRSGKCDTAHGNF